MTPRACPQGHPYTPENTRWTASGSPTCRTCDAERRAAARGDGFGVKQSVSPCVVCGEPVAQKPGRGRPKLYCPPCRRVVDNRHRGR